MITMLPRENRKEGRAGRQSHNIRSFYERMVELELEDYNGHDYLTYYQYSSPPPSPRLRGPRRPRPTRAP